jgi:hypothetical protein
MIRAPARVLGGFRRDKRGATSIEFAMIGLPFFLLISAVFEGALLCMAQLTLDESLDQAARQVFTGTFQKGADGTDPGARLRKLMCEGRAVIFSCADLKIEVAVSPTFTTIAPRDPYDAQNKAIASGFGSAFACPAGNDVVVIRAVSTAPHVMPVNLTGQPVGQFKQMIAATAVFQAEPYTSGKC